LAKSKFATTKKRIGQNFERIKIKNSENLMFLELW
jgi:hypothetical protein